MPSDFEQTLAATKRANLGHLLMRTARLFSDAGLARVNAAQDSALRPAHMQLFPHIDLLGTRQTTIAEKLGISKQAVGKLVADLESLGEVELVPDPTDRRARLVRFTEQGRRHILHGLSVLAQLEGELEDAISAERLDRLKEDLHAVMVALEG
ncbi:MAG: DNA-binding MarR family transcriptional regulator [Myxococcota bacterium]|jgi:DNA-binding MarR family transcriptional regulator